MDAASPPPVNLVANGTFETDLSGWAAVGGASLQRVAGGHSGSFAMLVTSPFLSLGSFGVTDAPNWVQLTTGIGARYHFRCWVRAEIGAGLVSLQVRESNSTQTGGWISLSAVSLSLSWTALDLDVVTALNGSTLDMQVLDTPAVLGTAFRMDDVSIVPTSTTVIADVSSLTGDRAESPGMHPNPMGAAGASFVFATSRPGAVSIAIYDLAGRRVRSLLGGHAGAGVHAVAFDGRGDDGGRLRDGIYYYRVESPDGTRSGRIVVMK